MPAVNREDLTLEKLREALDYNPRTGEFVWKVSLSSRVKVGSIAGTINKKPNENTGYIEIRLFGSKYQAHRLAFFSMTGKWPTHRVDHRNRDGCDNRWINLREATPSQNNANSTRPKNNTTGIKGVSFDRRRKMYVASLKVNGVTRNLGRFVSKDLAGKAYSDAAQKYFGEFAQA